MNAVERFESLTVGDVMTRDPVVVNVTDNMLEVAARLIEREVSGAPVVDDQGRCVGILTASDFVRQSAELHAVEDNVGGAHHLLEKPGPGEPLQVTLRDRDSISEQMTCGVQTVDATTSLKTAAEIMCRSHIHHLVVLDERGAPEGILTTLDIVAAMMKAIDEERQRSKP